MVETGRKVWCDWGKMRFFNSSFGNLNTLNIVFSGIWCFTSNVVSTHLNTVNISHPISFTRNDNIMLGIHLVLVTLHERFTINIEQNHRIVDTNYDV
jgi:hypothetical protein